MDLESDQESFIFPLTPIKQFLVGVSFFLGVFISYMIFTGSSEALLIHNNPYSISSLPSAIDILILSVAMYINGRASWSPTLGIPVIIFSFACMCSMVLFNQLLYTIPGDARLLYGPQSSNSLFCFLCLAISLWYKQNSWIAAICRWVVIVLAAATFLGYFVHYDSTRLRIFSDFGVNHSGIGFYSCIAMFCLSISNFISDAYYYKKV